jgi:MoaA/NifB/PqqE/SkfB family radical SAM enzyme
MITPSTAQHPCESNLGSVKNVTAKPFSRRVEFRLGFRCNARCNFCYYQDSLDDPVEKDPPTEDVIKRLGMIRRAGASEIEFTGGEPTIRRDLDELIRAAKRLGFTNISLITNGIRLANRDYAEKLCGAGANDFLFSIHGHNRDLHDKLTNVKGSFDKIIAAINNVRQFGARTRSSTTITAQNYQFVDKIFERLIDLEVSSIHIALFSPVASAQNSSRAVFIRYSDAASRIKDAISRYREDLPLVSVKYVPFCFMLGYENHVMNIVQQSYDPDDWNYYFSHKMRRGHKPVYGAALDLVALLAAIFSRNRSLLWKCDWLGIKVLGLTNIVQWARTKRLPACRKCRYDLVCDHVWKDYVSEFGSSEFVSVPGPKLKDPAWCYDYAAYRVPGDPVT